MARGDQRHTATTRRIDFHPPLFDPGTGHLKLTTSYTYDTVAMSRHSTVSQTAEAGAERPGSRSKGSRVSAGSNHSVDAPSSAANTSAAASIAFERRGNPAITRDILDH